MTAIISTAVGIAPFVAVYLGMSAFLGMNLQDPLDALDELASGERFEDVQVVRSYRSRDGRYCREFRLFEETGVRRCFACRNTEAWEVYRMIPEPANDDATSVSLFDQSVEIAISDVSDGAIVSPTAERNLIESGSWQPN